MFSSLSSVTEASRSSSTDIATEIVPGYPDPVATGSLFFVLFSYLASRSVFFARVHNTSQPITCARRGYYSGYRQSSASRVRNGSRSPLTYRVRLEYRSSKGSCYDPHEDSLVWGVYRVRSQRCYKRGRHRNGGSRRANSYGGRNEARVTLASPTTMCLCVLFSLGVYYGEGSRGHGNDDLRAANDTRK